MKLIVSIFSFFLSVAPFGAALDAVPKSHGHKESNRHSHDHHYQHQHHDQHGHPHHGKASADNAAKKARTLIAKSEWGIASYLVESNSTSKYPRGEVISFADHQGSIFFYMTGEQQVDLALTVTEANLPPYCTTLKTRGFRVFKYIL